MLGQENYSHTPTKHVIARPSLHKNAGRCFSRIVNAHTPVCVCVYVCLFVFVFVCVCVCVSLSCCMHVLEARARAE